MKKSAYILGRVANRVAWDRAFQKNCVFVVTSFKTYKGDRFYAGAVYVGPRDEYEGAAKPISQWPTLRSMRYRVIVKPKRNEMGLYLNPVGMTKEEWLKKYAEPINGVPTVHKENGRTVAVLVDNGWMTAAGLAYSAAELQAFTAPDRRKKSFFWVPDRLIGEFK
jgi:hypothetical protein